MYWTIFYTIELVFLYFRLAFLVNTCQGYQTFFFLKTKVIKLLIIYLILKVNKNINIQKGCGAMQFSYYKTANCTTPCGVMHCYLWCGAIISFFKQFWCDFCSLCGLVNTPNENYCANSITLTELTHSWVFFLFLMRNN